VFLAIFNSVVIPSLKLVTIGGVDDGVRVDIDKLFMVSKNI